MSYGVSHLEAKGRVSRMEDLAEGISVFEMAMRVKPGLTSENITHIAYRQKVE